MAQKQIGQCLQDRFLILFALGTVGEASLRVLADDRQHSKRPAVVRSICYEVVRPDVMPVLWPLTHTWAVDQPQAAPFQLFLRYFQPLATPDAIDAYVVYMPA